MTTATLNQTFVPATDFVKPVSTIGKLFSRYLRASISNWQQSHLKTSPAKSSAREKQLLWKTEQFRQLRQHGAFHFDYQR